MNRDEKIQTVCQEFDVLTTIDLDAVMALPMYGWRIELEKLLHKYHNQVFENHQRILFLSQQFDTNFFKVLQTVINKIDISNFFCIILLRGRRDLEELQTILSNTSTDPVPITVDFYDENKKTYAYNSSDPLKIDVSSLSTKHQELLTGSKTFCIYPWIHLHTYPTGDAWPCCQAEMQAGPIGSCKTQSLEEIWNSTDMRKLRRDMLTGKDNPLCGRCYEQESSGFFSGRQSANKHHGHHIHKVDLTESDGTVSDFQMTYWDLRFSNLCNLSCRSCGHIFSSSWYQDQAKLAGHEWRINNQPLNFAGRTETDIWEQLLPHFDYVEQIYFAGGEPLMMEEHYRILDELERRGRFDVRLIYNTNFTQTRLKDRSVFDYWSRFESVAVGASLDAMGDRAEYIRNGTRWDRVVENRERMMEICPNVDFYISPTLSIMNAWHLPDFHRDWVDRGLLRAQDLNVNILQDPAHYRVDIATAEFKQRLKERYHEHLAWLQPQDPLNRATVGFNAAIEFMMATDNTHLLETFWRRTHQLDELRNQHMLEVLPELEALT